MEIWITVGLVLLRRKSKLLSGRNFGFEMGFFVCIFVFIFCILFVFPLFNNLLCIVLKAIIKHR